MRYVASLPPLGEAPEPPQPAALYSAHAVNPVHARAPATSPQVGEFQPPRPAIPVTSQQTTPPEKTVRENRRTGEDRRQYCRRITAAETLLETRSSRERRRKNRRRGEPATAVDEEI